MLSTPLKMAKLLSQKLFACLYSICSDIVLIQENVEYYTYIMLFSLKPLFVVSSRIAQKTKGSNFQAVYGSFSF